MVGEAVEKKSLILACRRFVGTVKGNILAVA